MECRLELPRYHSGQAALLRKARRFNVLECGRRFGKTTMGQNLVIETALNGHPTGWFAPTYRTLTEQWRAIETAVKPVLAGASKMEGQIRLATGGVIDFWSLDNPDSGRGRKYKRIVIDEASIVRDLRQAWEQTIRPTLTDLAGDAWFLGTPKGRNYFHQLFTKGEAHEPDWAAWRRGSADNPLIPRAEIESAKRDLPKAIYEQEYEGIPADDGGNPFGLAAIRACVTDVSTEPAVAWGLDLAKSQDYTVAIGLDEHGHVCAFERWQGPWEVTITRCRSLINAHCLVDSTGVGDPVLEALQKGADNFEGFKFTSTSKQQLMEGLAVAIQRQEVGYPEGTILSELEAFEYEYTRTGVHYSAPQGLHDDCVCALALAERCLRTRMVSVASPGGDTRDSPWSPA